MPLSDLSINLNLSMSWRASGEAVPGEQNPSENHNNNIMQLVNPNFGTDADQSNILGQSRYSVAAMSVEMIDIQASMPDIVTNVVAANIQKVKVAIIRLLGPASDPNGTACYKVTATLFGSDPTSSDILLLGPCYRDGGLILYCGPEFVTGDNSDSTGGDAPTYLQITNDSAHDALVMLTILGID